MTFMTILRQFRVGLPFSSRIWLGRGVSAGDEAEWLLRSISTPTRAHSARSRGGYRAYDSDHVETHKPSGSRCTTTWCADLQPDIEAIGGTAKDKGKTSLPLDHSAKSSICTS